MWKKKSNLRKKQGEREKKNETAILQKRIKCLKSFKYCNQSVTMKLH
jgi:hypothetical protein